MFTFHYYKVQGQIQLSFKCNKKNDFEATLQASCSNWGYKNMGDVSHVISFIVRMWYVSVTRLSDYALMTMLTYNSKQRVSKKKKKVKY